MAFFFFVIPFLNGGGEQYLYVALEAKACGIIKEFLGLLWCDPNGKLDLKQTPEYVPSNSECVWQFSSAEFCSFQLLLRI